MPTLMTEPQVNVETNPPSPTALTLSFGGVEFTLTPSDTKAQLSYKANGLGTILSLDSFTGSLQVSVKKTVSSTTHSLPVTATVEEEPRSPEAVAPSNLPSVTPGQQKLSFQNPPNQRFKEPKKTQRKRSLDSRPAKKPIPAVDGNKKTRRDAAGPQQRPAPSVAFDKHTTEQSMSSMAPPSLCQTMDPTQPTQEVPDLSQSVPSSADQSGMMSSYASDLSRVQSTGSTEMHYHTKPKESVQEILNRVNGSSDSVLTVRDDEGSLPSTTAAATQRTPENSIEELPMETTETPTMDNTSGANTTSQLESTSASPESYPSPCPRWGHTMTKLLDDRLLVYGGQSFDLDGKPVILADVHIYDTGKRCWSKPMNCRGDARQWHTATFLPARQLLISFGGETYDVSKKNKVISSDSLKVLDTDIMLWYPPAVSGDVPTGRSGHTATLLPNTNELILFGGVKGSKWLNTVSILDTVSWIWTTPKVQGSAPKPRSYHSATAVRNLRHGGTGVGMYKLVIFGGNNKTSSFNTVHVLEMDETTKQWKWSHPSVQGQPPFPRTGHSATMLDDEKTLCIYGGWDPNDEDAESGEENIFRSSFLLDTEKWTWSKGPKPTAGGSGTEDSTIADCGPKRCGHTAALNPDSGEVLSFGGRIPGEVLAGDFQRLGWVPN